MLEHWALASSLTNFKLDRKTATLIAIFMAKCDSDLTFKAFIISAFFFSVMPISLFLLDLADRQIDWVIFHFKFILNQIPVLMFAPCFILRLIYGILSLLGRSQMDLMCPFYW